VLLVPRDFFVHAQVGWPDATLLEAREGRDGILAAMEYTRASVCGSGLYACPATCPDFAHRRLAFGSISYASTTMPARRYMRMEGHLPMMFAAEPKRALQVCFGTGTTAGALAAWPALQKATIVDLNPDVIDFARHFPSVNAGVLTDPRFQVVIDDGRHFLLTTSETYDAVSFEPPPPRAQGVVNLYSREFYALVKEHLTDGGVVAQWLPMDQQSMRLNRELIAAVRAEFPHTALYVPSRFHGVLLASRQPLTPKNWDALFAVPSLKASFEDVGFFSPDDVHATFVAGDEGLARLAGDAPPVTDDRPSIEHFLGSLDAPVTADVLQAVAAPSSDPKVAARWKLVRSTQRQNEGDYAGARALVEEAEALAGKTSWTAYLREVTYGCLAPKSAHTRAD
jgi:spermidine synthase